MTTSLEIKEAKLKGYGVTRVTEGEHHDAWRAFWGTEIELEEQPVWKQWLDALKPHKRNTAMIDAATALGILSESDSPVLPSCTFLSTPWKTTLSCTDGRIMVNEDYKRLEAQALEYSGTARCSDVVIAGQSGSGRTYLSHFILAHALARRQNMIFFTGKRIFVFSSLGVFSGDKLDLNFVNYGDFDNAIGGKPLALVDVAKDSDELGPVQSMFFSIRIYPPSSRQYERWIDRYNPAMLVLDAHSSSFVVTAATLQLDISATKASLQQLLARLRMAGPNLRSCFSLDSSTLHTSLRDYVASLSIERLLTFAEGAQFSPYPVEIARQEDGPDIFLLRRDITTYESCLPTIASRHVLCEIGRMHGSSGLAALRSMEVVRRSPDGFSETRNWLFENMCHTLLSTGSSEDLSPIVLSQCFPPGASKRKGALNVAHICVSRSMRTFDLRSPPSFDPAVYHIVETLVDGTMHAMIHTEIRDTSLRPGKPHANTTPVTEQRRKLRPRGPTATIREDRASKRRKLPAERRFVIFLQVVSDSPPQFPDDGLKRLETVMHSDAEAEYFFVFVTARDAVLDLSAVPLAWSNRLKWYHLSASVSIDMTSDRSDTQSEESA